VLWAAAASVALLASVGFWWFQMQKTTAKTTENTVFTEGGILEENIQNTTDKAMNLTMPDGSTVVLEKNSQVRFAKDFKGASRAVYLTGEALFDVVKNPDKPFIVYTGDLVTKVLGTSFRIKSFGKAEKVTVDVIRGRVSVFENKKTTNKDPETEGLVLTPNQKATFDKAAEQLKKTLVEEPTIILTPQEVTQLVYEEAPVSTILKGIEKAYGVEVVFDEERLKKCELTMKFKNETLHDKLTILCKSIGATYKVVDAKVILAGGECD
jgi:transmembrane sensor